MAEDKPKITLHWLNGSRAQGTLFLLEALEVPYELEIYNRQPNKLAPPELEKLHPLGKSPVVLIEVPGAAEPIVLAESAFIVQYLSDHFGNGKPLVPQRWKEGQEGRVGGETETWMRYQYLLYYAEGSFMPTMFLKFIMDTLKGSSIPFFIRPLTRVIANQLTAQLVFPNLKRHFTLLEQWLTTSPGGGAYLCGPDLTGGDIMLSYPLSSALETNGLDDAGVWEKGSFKETFPKSHAYMVRLTQEPAWKRSVDKIKSIEGSCKLLP